MSGRRFGVPGGARGRRLGLAAAVACGLAGGAAAVPVIGPINVTNKVEATRAQAFGGAAAAIGNDPTLVWVNPASPAQTAVTAVTVGGQRGYFDDVTGQGLYTTPLQHGVLSVGALYYDEGQTIAVRPDDSPVNAKLQQDLLGAVGYATTLSPQVSTGALIKSFHSRLAEEAATTALAGDLGIQVLVSPTVKLGGVIQNVGTRMQFDQESVGLPTTARGGVAAGWRFKSLGTDAGRLDTVIAIADLEYLFADQIMVKRVGVEYQWRGLIALRAGARLTSRLEPGTYAAGIGLRWGRLRVDYTMRMSPEYASPQTLTLTVAFPPGTGTAAAAAAVRTRPALTDQETTLRQPQVLPEAEPAEPTVLPERRKRPAGDEPPPGGQDGLIDDLNRHLDDLLKPGSEPPRP